MADDFKEINVLFFDDKKFLIKGLQRHFKSMFTCHIATTTEEAQKVLDDNEIKILVADHQMPENAGVELLKKMKDDSGMRKILTTSDRHSDLVLNMTQQGLVNGIVYTPLNRATLKEELLEQAKLLVN